MKHKIKTQDDDGNTIDISVFKSALIKSKKKLPQNGRKGLSFTKETLIESYKN